jgi:hypothetical protein
MGTGPGDMGESVVAVDVKTCDEPAAKGPLHIVMDPKIWTRKRPFLRWSAALKMEERQCHERVRITHPA